MANKDVQLSKKGSGMDGLPTSSATNYNRDIDAAKVARNNQLKDTDPRIEKEGFLGVDDLDRLRRRHIK